MLRASRLAGVGLLTLFAYLVLFQRDLLKNPWVQAMAAKSIGMGPECPWGQLASAPWSLERFLTLRTETAQSIRQIGTDPAVGILHFSTATRPFWIADRGVLMNGGQLLAYVLAEQTWLSERAPEHVVRPGDVVMDVGAHVGTFGDDALRRGASKVIMVEPDPVNQECIRRNFAAEIASGQVILVPEGAWNSEGTLDFHLGIANSGGGSLLSNEPGAQTVKVPVRPIDHMVEKLRIDRIDFMKMDIEGAERNALRGAASTLRRFRPRLMLDAYHLPDDGDVLPKVILATNPTYSMTCAACGMGHSTGEQRFVPYALFFH